MTIRKSLLSLATLTLLSFAPVSAQLPSFTPFGTGCAGSNGVPKLDALPQSLPFVGIPFQVLLTILPTKPGGVYIILGFDKAAWGPFQLPADLGIFGLFGCSLYQSVDFVFPWSSPGGSTLFILPIPNDPSLAGLVFCLQGLIMDDMAPNPVMRTVTNSGRGVIGLG